MSVLYDDQAAQLRRLMEEPLSTLRLPQRSLQYKIENAKFSKETPRSARVRVARMRTAVVLPAPLGPRTARIFPSGTSRSMPRRACTT